ncbi:hypothetical protein [Burkholderia multivorans]|uniref:hypothetical protein n=1 Tax=Burkholderia multivorans TaxID=87883 RepID=UPI001C25269C|nr:hypothetical protein [Burkholderia multivorans]MBU9526162.1 hypothetical protein [Burkholderia multivorans]
MSQTLTQKEQIAAHLQSMHGFVNTLKELGTANDVWNFEFDLDKTPIARELSLSDSELYVYFDFRNLAGLVDRADEYIASIKGNDSSLALESARSKLNMTHELMEALVKRLDAAATDGNMIEFREQLRAGWATYNEARTREPVTF